MAALVVPSSNPAQDFSEAVERVRSLQNLDGPEVYPTSGTQLLVHGRRCEHTILLLHGFTASPHQFRSLGEKFFTRGFNVLIPRAPYHGLVDSRTTLFVRLTSNQLLAILYESVDITCGLGEKITVCGLSMGGVLAAWAAQYRSEVDTAASISPAFNAKVLPRRLSKPAVWLARRLPNRFLFDDPQGKKGGLPHGTYPRMATHPLAHIFSLSQRLFDQARRQPPTARRVVMITNPHDQRIDNQAAAALVKSWRAAGAENIEEFSFEEGWKLPHDLIHPEHAEQQTERVYPILLDLLCTGQED